MNLKSTQSTHIVFKKRSRGDEAFYEKIGALWQREDGSAYLRLVGKQVITSDLHIFPYRGK
jgi:hypothetical protein